MLDPLSLRPIRRDFETVKVNTLQDSPGQRSGAFLCVGGFSLWVETLRRLWAVLWLSEGVYCLAFLTVCFPTKRFFHHDFFRFPHGLPPLYFLRSSHHHEGQPTAKPTAGKMLVLIQYQRRKLVQLSSTNLRDKKQHKTDVIAIRKRLQFIMFVSWYCWHCYGAQYIHIFYTLPQLSRLASDPVLYPLLIFC